MFYALCGIECLIRFLVFVLYLFDCFEVVISLLVYLLIAVVLVIDSWCLGVILCLVGCFYVCCSVRFVLFSCLFLCWVCCLLLMIVGFYRLNWVVCLLICLGLCYCLLCGGWLTVYRGLVWF